MRKPLEGIRVVEMGTHVAVPKAARMMAEWGAEVIKIEPPGGDPRRTTGMHYKVPATMEYNVLWQPENAYKKSLALNLKDPEAREVLFKLLEDTDVVLTNTRLQGLKKLGLDYDSLKDKYPKLIYAHFTGFGLNGPAKDRPGFDLTAFFARSGILASWPFAESGPLSPAGGFGDTVAGSMFLNGILAAIINRSFTGQGDKVDLSLYGTAIFMDSTQILVATKEYGHSFPRARLDVPSHTIPPFKTKDGDWYMISIVDWDNKSPAFFEAIGMGHLKDDPSIVTLEGSIPNMPAVLTAMDEGVGNTSSADLEAILLKLDTIYERLTNSNEIVEDEQAWANNYVENVTFESGDTVAVPTLPLSFASFPREPQKLAPRLGEDTEAILKDLGYSADKIKALEDSGAVIADKK